MQANAWARVSQFLPNFANFNTKVTNVRLDK